MDSIMYLLFFYMKMGRTAGMEFGNFIRGEEAGVSWIKVYAIRTGVNLERFISPEITLLKRKKNIRRNFKSS